MLLGFLARGCQNCHQCRYILHAVHRSMSVQVKACCVRTCPSSWLQLVCSLAALFVRRHSQYIGCSVIHGHCRPLLRMFSSFPCVFLGLLCWCEVPISQLSIAHTIRTSLAVDIPCVTHDHSSPTQWPFPPHTEPGLQATSQIKHHMHTVSNKVSLCCMEHVGTRKHQSVRIDGFW